MAVVERVFQDFLEENYPGEAVDDVFVGLASKARSVDQIKFAARYHQIQLPLDDTVLNKALTVLQAVLATYEVDHPTFPRDPILRVAISRKSTLRPY